MVEVFKVLLSPIYPHPNIYTFLIFTDQYLIRWKVVIVLAKKSMLQYQYLVFDIQCSVSNI